MLIQKKNKIIYKSLSLFLIALLFLLSFSFLSQAAVQVIGSEFKVINGTDGPNIASAYNSIDNEYLVAWEFLGDIKVQRLNSVGAPVGNLINVDTDGMSSEPNVVYNSRQNEYLVAWTGQLSGQADIYAQKITNTGSLIGSNIKISNSSQRDFRPSGIYNSQTNEYFFVYQIQHSDTDIDIWSVRIDSSNFGIIGSTVIKNTSGEDKNPKIVYSPKGLLIVGESQGDIFGQRIDVDSGALLNQIKITENPTIQNNPQLCWSSDSKKFVIIYEDKTNGLNIAGKIIDPNGSFTVQPFFVTDNSGNNIFYSPSVSCDSTGNGFNVFRVEDTHVFSSNFYLTGLSSVEGFQIQKSNEIIINSAGSIPKGQPQPVFNTTNDESLILWPDARNDVILWDIYGARVMETEPRPAPSPVLQKASSSLNLKASPRIISLGKSSIISGALNSAEAKRYAFAKTAANKLVPLAGKKIIIKAKIVSSANKKKKAKYKKLYQKYNSLYRKTKNKKFKKRYRKLAVIYKKAYRKTKVIFWKTIAKVFTNSNGKFVKTLRPKTTTIYKAEFSGDSSYKKANSSTAKISVKKPKKKAKKKK